jgi:methanogenic corrinoid protein MtbC1
MASRRNALQEKFFNSLISGDRTTARQVVADVLDSDCTASRVITHLFWPTVEHLQKLHRNDQLSELCYHYATRLLRALVDQMQLRLEQSPRNRTTVLMACGPEESEELAAQMAADLLEAGGYNVYFLGGGVANDEIVEQLAELRAEKLVVFGGVPSTVPQTRLLIDRLHRIGACPKLQIIVGGGVFNRAQGLAEEIGADIWVSDPEELVDLVDRQSHQRMTPDQRTVGRKRRSTTGKNRSAA